MPTNFPQALDQFQNPRGDEPLATPRVLHHAQHTNANDAIMALEAYVGVEGSTDPKSISYRIKTTPHRVVADVTERNALREPADVIPGALVVTADNNEVFQYLGTGKWFSLIPPPVDQGMPLALAYNPAVATDGLTWIDARGGVRSVGTEADLTAIPAATLNEHAIVFVRDPGHFYQYIVPAGGTPTATLRDWQHIVDGVTYVARAGGLPAGAVDGQLFVVRSDFAGNDLYRLLSWDLSITWPAPPAPPAVVTTITPGATDADPVTIAFASPGPVSPARTVDIQLLVDGAPLILSPRVSGSDDDFAIAIASLLNSQADLTATRTANVVTVQADAGHTLEVQVVDVPTPPAPPAPPPGGWRVLNGHVWNKAIRATADQATDQHEGDLQITREDQHEEIKSWNAVSRQWDTIYSRDEINGAIAAMSLFEGTVGEVLNPPIGAAPFHELPDLMELTGAGDLSKVSHYWTFIGTPNTVVRDQQAVNAGANFHELTINPLGLPGNDGDPIMIDFHNRPPNPTMGVTRPIVFVTRIEERGVPEEIKLVLDISQHWSVDDVVDEFLAQWLDSRIVVMKAGTAQMMMQPVTGVAIKRFFVLADGSTPYLGVDLNGAILNPGDWVMIANRGGDGTGQGANGGPPSLHWVTIGGDLLSKSRADRLYALARWNAAGWEQGAIVTFQGGVYRASRPVSAADPNPNPVPPPVSTPLSGTTTHSLDGTPAAALPAAPANGDIEEAAGAGTIAAGGPFAGRTYVLHDRFVYVSDPAFAGAGTTQEGFDFAGGWIAIGQAAPSDPFVATGETLPTPWAPVDISGGLKMATTDADLPASAPPGEVWIVLQSAAAGGKQALFGYDRAAGQWQQLGGSDGTALDFSGGRVVYPKALFYNGEVPADLTAVALPTPRIIGDELYAKNQAGYPILVALSKDGLTWSPIHPQRYKDNLNDSASGVQADYPMQMLVGMANVGTPPVKYARVTHIADRSRAWVPVQEAGGGKIVYTGATGDATFPNGNRKTPGATIVSQNFTATQNKRYLIDVCFQIYNPVTQAMNYVYEFELRIDGAGRVMTPVNTNNMGGGLVRLQAVWSSAGLSGTKPITVVYTKCNRGANQNLIETASIQLSVVEFPA